MDEPFVSLNVIGAINYRLRERLQGYIFRAKLTILHSHSAKKVFLTKSPAPVPLPSRIILTIGR